MWIDSRCLLESCYSIKVILILVSVDSGVEMLHQQFNTGTTISSRGYICILHPLPAIPLKVSNLLLSYVYAIKISTFNVKR